jgi:hypothetical protein
MSLKQRIIDDMTAAMRAKDAPRLSTLRMVKAAMMNRQIEKGGELTDEELVKMLQSLVKQRRDSVEQYERGGRAELASKERAEIGVIEEYSMKEMGAVMKAAQARLAGRAADGRMVSEIVKARLG